MEQNNKQKTIALLLPLVYLISLFVILGGWLCCFNIIVHFDHSAGWSTIEGDHCRDFFEFTHNHSLRARYDNGMTNNPSTCARVENNHLGKYGNGREVEPDRQHSHSDSPLLLARYDNGMEKQLYTGNIL